MEDNTVVEEPLPLNSLAKAYLKIRSAIQVEEQKHEQTVAALKEQRDAIATAMKDRLRAENATSMKTAAGTVILTTSTRYYTQDWDEMKKFIVENDAVDLLEHRISQRNMQQWIEQNPEKVPPGLSSTSEYSVSVRKASK